MIKIKSLVKVYKTGDEEVRAVDGINLEISQGETVAFSGASGSGKTTLLNLIGTLDGITSGDITIDGVSLARMSEKEKTSYRKLNLGFIFQSYNLIPVLSAKENVELAFQPLSKDEIRKLGIDDTSKAAEEALRQVGLECYGNRKPGQLSGGQQQRVSIARAIVRKPRILLADEPTANLDSKNSQLILTLLSRLSADNGITVIYSSHDQEVLENVNRVVILKDGRVMEDRRC
ncbi:MAG: ABC transporter ATP-binding protein [Bullifex sp.]